MSVHCMVTVRSILCNRQGGSNPDFPGFSDGEGKLTLKQRSQNEMVIGAEDNLIFALRFRVDAC